MTRMLLQTTCPGSPLTRYCHGIVTVGVLGGLVLAATAGYSYGSSGDDAKASPDSKANTTEKSAKKAKKDAEPVVAQKMELPVTKLDAPGLARYIDQVISARLSEEKVQSAALADDAEFLRRVYLDITGVIPTADQVVAFLDSRDPNKRTRLIDELLASPQYGRHMADMWQSYLVPRTSDGRRVQPAPLVRWLEESFSSNKPWNQFVAELITASGSQDQNGAVTFFLANQTSDKYTDTVCRLFLGVQLQCAQCHNHPFTGWKQDEY